MSMWGLLLYSFLAACGVAGFIVLMANIMQAMEETMKGRKK
jgi:hypothetical protein